MPSTNLFISCGMSGGCSIWSIHKNKLLDKTVQICNFTYDDISKAKRTKRTQKEATFHSAIKHNSFRAIEGAPHQHTPLDFEVLVIDLVNNCV